MPKPPKRYDQHIIPVESIQQRIYLIPGYKVMLDADLADLYGTTTGRMNEQVRRNAGRFPEDFMFQLTEAEHEVLRSQIAISNGQGNTVEFYLSRTRGIAAAKAFFRKALKHHREPHSITLNGHRPIHSALRRMGMNGEFNFRGRNPVKIRCCQYLNNVVEQDHRRVKGRLRPMLGFKMFYNARRVITGIELAQKIHKRQFAIPITLQSNPAVIWRHVMAA